MHNELTQSDIKKMEEEIEYRKLVVRKNAIRAVQEAREDVYKRQLRRKLMRNE